MIGLAVHPDFQRQGVARKLIEWVIAHAPSLDHTRVVLDTIRETGNVPLFQRLGFRVVSERLANWCVSSNHQELHDVKMERVVTQEDISSWKPASRRYQCSLKLRGVEPVALYVVPELTAYHNRTFRPVN